MLEKDGAVENFLAAEIVVDHPLGCAGALGDLVDPPAAVAALRELLGRYLDDLGAGSLRVLDH